MTQDQVAVAMAGASLVCSSNMQLCQCRYDLVMVPVINLVCQILSKAKRITTETDLHYLDLEKIPGDLLCIVCQWLSEAVDLFSKNTGDLIHGGSDDRTMKVTAAGVVLGSGCRALSCHSAVGRSVGRMSYSSLHPACVCVLCCASGLVECIARPHCTARPLHRQPPAY